MFYISILIVIEKNDLPDVNQKLLLLQNGYVAFLHLLLETDIR